MDIDVLTEIVLPKLEGIRKQAGGYMARCPAHDDGKASLSLTRGTEQPVVMNCHAGCERDAILAAIGLIWADICKPRKRRDEAEWTPKGPAASIYDYVDETGTLLFQVVRTAGKDFFQRVPDPSRKGGWSWKLGSTRRVLYRLPKVIEGVKNGDVIWICEGEKDVQALEAVKLVATCNPMGAGKWRPEFTEFLRGADVTIVADKDKPGYVHARAVAASLGEVANTVRIVEAAVGKDAADHLGAGKSIVDFVETWTSEEESVPDLAPDLHEFLSIVDPPNDWIIEGMLERGDRLILTGFEGLGKSMLVRQIAVAVAAGLHPFSGEPGSAKRVLFIDCENSERQGRRKLRPLERTAALKGKRVPEGNMRIIHRPAGIDLTREDAPWLLERVAAHQPDLLVIGPLYRLHAADTNEEGAARAVVQVLDAARTKADCALLVEAHAGHAGEGRNRAVRPFGSSLFLRWPEFGYGLVPRTDNQPCDFVAFQPWRGARDERRWPKHLRYGSSMDWPWIDANS